MNDIEAPQFDSYTQRKVDARKMMGENPDLIAFKIHDRLGRGDIQGDDDLDYMVAGYFMITLSFQAAAKDIIKEKKVNITPEEAAFREGKLFERLRNYEYHEMKREKSLKELIRRLRRHL